MPTIQDLTSDLIAAEVALDAALDGEESVGDGDEAVARAQAALDAVAGEFDEKAAKIARWIRDLSAEESLIREEVDRLVARANARKNKARWLKAWLLSAMQTANVPRVRSPLVTLWINGGKPKVVVPPALDADALATIFATPSPETDALRQYITRQEKYALDLKGLLSTASDDAVLPDALAALGLRVDKEPFLTIR